MNTWPSWCVKPPSLEAIQKVSMEPEAMAMSAYTTTEVKLAPSVEESIKLMRQTKEPRTLAKNPKPFSFFSAEVFAIDRLDLTEPFKTRFINEQESF
jgi:hypothetical protein